VVGMPGMNMPAPSAKASVWRKAATKKTMRTHATTAAQGTGGAGMSSSIDLLDPMAQEASGTAWLPASSPMYGKMYMPNGNMLMLHGAAMPRYTDIGSKRGDRRFDAPNWEMGMFSHPLTADSQLGLRAMFSLDPITEGGYGYPLLYQTGESWHHQPLHDRQHPHDLIDELAATYSHKLSSNRSAYIYVGYPGEPALGPPTYMHRLLAYDLADAPIGHHWQDATHVTFGVATAGINFGSKLKLEASDFTGREPDENRYSFDKPRFDSYSSRLSFNPNADNATRCLTALSRMPRVTEPTSTALRPRGFTTKVWGSTQTSPRRWFGARTISRPRARRTRTWRRRTISVERTRSSREWRTSRSRAMNWFCPKKVCMTASSTWEPTRSGTCVT